LSSASMFPRTHIISSSSLSRVAHVHPPAVVLGSAGREAVEAAAAKVVAVIGTVLCGVISVAMGGNGSADGAAAGAMAADTPDGLCCESVVGGDVVLGGDESDGGTNVLAVAVVSCCLARFLRSFSRCSVTGTADPVVDAAVTCGD